MPEEVKEKSFYLWVSDLWNSPIRTEEGTQWEVRFGPEWKKKSNVFAYLNQDYRLVAQIPSEYHGKRAAIKSHDGRKFYSASGEIRMPLKDGQLQDLNISELNSIAPMVGDESFMVVGYDLNSEMHRQVSLYFNALHLRLMAYNILTPEQRRAILRMDTYEESRYLNIISNLSIIPGLYHPSLWAEPGFRFFRVIAELNYAKQNIIIPIDNAVYADTQTSRYDVEWMMARRDILKEQLLREQAEEMNFLTRIYMQRGR
ncbi:MAG: hypothetical protein V1860_01355 [bacterium]